MQSTRFAAASAAMARSVVAQPGSMPVKKHVLLPALHAASIGSRNSAGAVGGCASANAEYVMTLVPRSRNGTRSAMASCSRPMLLPKYVRQSAPRPSTSFQSLVARTPAGATPTSSPESLSAFSAVLT